MHIRVNSSFLPIFGAKYSENFLIKNCFSENFVLPLTAIFTSNIVLYKIGSKFSPTKLAIFWIRHFRPRCWPPEAFPENWRTLTMQYKVCIYLFIYLRFDILTSIVNILRDFCTFSLLWVFLRSLWLWKLRKKKTKKV